MAGPEAKFQSEMVKWLRSKGCVVYKLQANATTRVAQPDILALKDGFWLAIEAKASKNAKRQPGQKEMIEKLNEMSWAKIVWPDIWEETKKELEEMLR